MLRDWDIAAPSDPMRLWTACDRAAGLYGIRFNLAVKQLPMRMKRHRTAFSGGMQCNWTDTVRHHMIHLNETQRPSIYSTRTPLDKAAR